MFTLFLLLQLFVFALFVSLLFLLLAHHFLLLYRVLGELFSLTFEILCIFALLITSFLKLFLFPFSFGLELGNLLRHLILSVLLKFLKHFEPICGFGYFLFTFPFFCNLVHGAGHASRVARYIVIFTSDSNLNPVIAGVGWLCKATQTSVVGAVTCVKRFKCMLHHCKFLVLIMTIVHVGWKRLESLALVVGAGVRRDQFVGGLHLHESKLSDPAGSGLLGAPSPDGRPALLRCHCAQIATLSMEIDLA